jgi:hypothetical protein
LRKAILLAGSCGALAGRTSVLSEAIDELEALRAEARGLEVMGSPKHTPGPWSTRTETLGSAREVIEDLERMLAAGGLHNFTITMVVAPDRLPNPPPGDGTVCVAYLGNGPTAEANGALLARAPSLLSENEALKARVAELELQVETRGRWLREAALSQREDGSLPYVAPTPVPLTPGPMLCSTCERSPIDCQCAGGAR